MSEYCKIILRLLSEYCFVRLLSDYRQIIIIIITLYCQIMHGQIIIR